jgi:hypothetical protein
MENLSQSTWLVSGGLIVLSIAVLTCARLGGPRKLVVRRLVSSIGLPVDERADQAVGAAQGRRAVGIAIGGVVGTVSATWFVWLVGADRDGPAPLFLIGAYAVAASLGRAVASISGEAKKLGGTDHVAHVRFRNLSDYIPGWERVAARTMVGVAIATLSFEMALPWIATDDLGQVFPETFSVAAAATLLAVVALIGFEVGGRLILRVRQSQGSELGLAWDDLLRSFAVRDLATAAFLLGTFGVFFAVQEVLMAMNPLDPPFIASAAGFNLVGTFVVIAAALESLLPRPRQHILRRRHPDLVSVGAQ